MRSRNRPLVPVLRLLAAAGLVAGCGGSEITGPLSTPPVPVTPIGKDSTGAGGAVAASSIQASAGDQQSGTVGRPAAQPLEVRVLDASGVPVPRVVVTFVVKNAATASGHGSVLLADTTGSDGLASTPFTFGTLAGLDTIVATTRTTNATLTQQFVLRAMPTAAKQLQKLTTVALQDTVGVTLRDTLIVAVRDTFNNVIPNLDVTWTVPAGAGSVAIVNAQTDAAGRARAVWTLGTAQGTETVTATVAAVAPVTFSATALGAGVASLRVASGDVQTASAGSLAAQPLVVQALDAKGAAVSGAPVTFAAITGGGTLSKLVDTTDAQGLARTRLTVGTTAGTNTVSVTANAKQASFAVRSTAAAAKTLVQVNGNNGQDTVRATLRDTLILAVRDTFNNPVPGVAVTWTITQGGGAVQLLTQPTDSAGRARALWTLGTAKGANSLTASVAGVPALTYNAVALGAPASTITLVSGDNQLALVNQYVGDSITVRVEDAYGNVVAGAPITWRASNGGLAEGKQPTSGASGIASATWKLGSQPGPQSVTVTVNGRSVTFAATATLQYRTVDAGSFDACGITPSAQAYCWGYNGDGQLGSGAGSNRNVPTPIAGSLTFRQLSGGRYHTCGITLSGIGYCWGDNHDGRLGTNDQTSSIQPVQVSSAVTFQSIAAGRVQSCGLALSGLVYCWGFNQEGEVGAYIGVGADSTVVKIPRPVSGQSFKTLSVGGLHACAIDIADDLYCWGFNNFGQLGNSTSATPGCTAGALNAVPWTLNNQAICDASLKVTSAVGLPVPVSKPAGVTSWKAIAAGYRHSCAIGNDNRTYCWGENQKGQLGNGTSSPNAVTYSPQLVQVPAGVAFTSLSSGFAHSCGLTASGTAYCWGDNTGGKFGNGTETQSNVATLAAGGKLFSYISAGEALTCGVTSGGAGQTANVAFCWGDNSYGQLGDGTNNNAAAPAKIAFQP